MTRILLLFAHPALEKSRVHRRLLQRLPRLPGLTLQDLYEAYPDFDVDVRREQELLLAHDLILFQHSFYWYSTPALLKQWQDLVLEHGWAYGSTGTALRGKRMANVITTGGSASAYGQGGAEPVHCPGAACARRADRPALWHRVPPALSRSGNPPDDRRGHRRRGNPVRGHTCGVSTTVPFEFMLNALRLVDGFAEDLFPARCGLPLATAAGALSSAVERGWLEREAGRIRPTRQGRLFLDDLVGLFLPAHKWQVAHGMAEAEAAALELGERTGFCLVGFFQQGFRRQDCVHLLRILRPVGGGVEVAARPKLARGERGERRLHEPAIVMALLRPGIGKEEVYPGEGGVGNLVRQHVNRVVPECAGSRAQLLNIEGLVYQLQLKLSESIISFEAALNIGQSMAGYIHYLSEL